MSTDACSCGCSTMTTVTNADHQCGCGCDCCVPSRLSREDEIIHLRRLRKSADQRLEELEAG